MTRVIPQLCSVVLIGNFNPSILNHDFLVMNNIIPDKAEPFDALLKNQVGKQYDNFISTPIMSSISYGKINIVVEPERFSISHSGTVLLDSSPIVGVVKKYFEVLRFTPITKCGVNFHDEILFESIDEERELEKRIGIVSTKLKEFFNIEPKNIGIIFSYTHEGANAEVNIMRPRDSEKRGRLHLNWEFNCNGSIDQNFLDKAKIISLHFASLEKQVISG